MSEKIQYTKDEVRDMMLTLDFVAIPIDTTKLKEYTRPVETTVFGIPIKLELINFNNKFEYQYMNDDIILQIYDNGILHANGYYKNGSSDSYVLLGGGGHKLVSDFMLKTDELSNNLTTITKSLNVTQAWMDTGITSTNLPANGTYIV